MNECEVNVYLTRSKKEGIFQISKNMHRNQLILTNPQNLNLQKCDIFKQYFHNHHTCSICFLYCVYTLKAQVSL